MEAWRDYLAEYKKYATKKRIEKLDENQDGFIPGRSCADNLFITQQLIEKQINHNHEHLWLPLIIESLCLSAQ